MSLRLCEIRKRPLGLFVLVNFLLFGPPISVSAVESPGIGEIIKRVLKASTGDAAQHEEESKFLFDKLSISEELDGQGNIKSRREKLYEVRQIGGIPSMHLVKVNGKVLSEEEQPRRKSHEKKVHEQKKNKKESRQDFISQDLISRFTFTLQEIEVLNGRDTFVIAFRPKTNDLTINSIEERVISRLAGRVWIDAHEYDLAGVECHLLEKTGIWGGLLGSIQDFHMSLHRRREGPRVWFNEDFQFEVRARKLLENVHLRIHEVATNFRKVTGTEKLD